MSHKANYWLAELDPNRVKAGAFRVLFHLCSHHNADEPYDRACFPSQATLMKRTALSNGGLNNALNALEESSLIRRVRTTIPGQQTPRTYYVLGCDYEDWRGQTPKSGVKANSTLDGGQTPLSEVADSTFEGGKLQPSGDDKVITGKVIGKDKIETPLSILCKAASENAATSFLAYRKKTKGGAVTETAAKRILSSLYEIMKAGYDPDDALGMAEERGWQTVKFDWYMKEKRNEPRTHSQQSTPRPENRVDPALSNIARLLDL